MYQILDWGRLRRFSHIIWDIDGTITEKDILSDEVTIKILDLAQNGVYHSFITGRDAGWLIKQLIKPMQKFFNFTKVMQNLVFYAEVGCVLINADAQGNYRRTFIEEIENHPLRADEGNIRAVLKGLAFDPDNPEKLRRWQRGDPIPTGFDPIYDANGVGYLVDVSQPAPACHPYVWSPTKEAFATFEKIRNEEGGVKSFDQAPYEEIIADAIAKAGFADQIKTETVSTAINIVPAINKTPLGKSWAAGRAIMNIQEHKLSRSVGLDTVVTRTVAVGDGMADFDFTVPSFPTELRALLQHSTIPIVFVGQERDLPPCNSPKHALCKNTIIQATGLGELQFLYTKEMIRLRPATGPRVVSAVLDFLKNWDYFGSFE
jgi:hypothetical protein